MNAEPPRGAFSRYPFSTVWQRVQRRSPGGGFRTASSRLVERFRLLKGGTVLSVKFSWTAPSVFQNPHSYEFRYQRAEREYGARPYTLCDPFDPERVAFFEQPK